MTGKGNPSPNVVLGAVFLIGFGVLLEMNFLLIHHLGNARYESTFYRTAWQFLSDLLTQHHPLEVVFLAATGYTFYQIVGRSARQAVAGRKWTRYFAEHADAGKMERLNAAYRKWNIPITIVRDPSVLALTTGFIRPRIVLSTGLIRLLSAEELEAVLLHERYHCRQRHTVKKFAVQLMMDGIGYIPIIRSLGRHYFIGIELSADRYAMDQMNSSYEIGSVLLKLVRHNGQYAGVGAGGTVHFADTAVNYRIEQIVNPDQPVRVALASAKTVAISAILLSLMLAALLLECPI
ncbi:M56 family metallopeptidase [Paenibacillus humicola]|uniref:M56 family metallopeptidase n=1 Tax=Paenibacillus humicola TaxID=3110540 RepID=UPI00237B0472|nr:M56 family metallopeptidase [Paenibacillus humicola]